MNRNPCTLLVGVKCVKLITPFFMLIVPTPLVVCPPQHIRYVPFSGPVEMNCIELPGLDSSAMHTSNTITVKLHCALLPAVSVTTHVTVLVPNGKALPLGGLQTTLATPQLSAVIGGG